MVVATVTKCPTAIYGTQQTDSHNQVAKPPADAIKLLWVKAPESHPTYLLPLSSQPRQDKCSFKANPIYSHRVSLSQTQLCRQCTRMAKWTKGC